MPLLTTYALATASLMEQSLWRSCWSCCRSQRRWGCLWLGLVWVCLKVAWVCVVVCVCVFISTMNLKLPFSFQIWAGPVQVLDDRDDLHHDGQLLLLRPTCRSTTLLFLTRLHLSSRTCSSSPPPHSDSPSDSSPVLQLPRHTPSTHSYITFLFPFYPITNLVKFTPLTCTNCAMSDQWAHEGALSRNKGTSVDDATQRKCVNCA